MGDAASEGKTKNPLQSIMGVWNSDLQHYSFQELGTWLQLPGYLGCFTNTCQKIFLCRNEMHSILFCSFWYISTVCQFILNLGIVKKLLNSLIIKQCKTLLFRQD